VLLSTTEASMTSLPGCTSSNEHHRQGGQRHDDALVVAITATAEGGHKLTLAVFACPNDDCHAPQPALLPFLAAWRPSSTSAIATPCAWV
jgi:hypothetical protein